MLSDSSASDSPVKRKKVIKRAVCSSDDDESDNPIKKWKGNRRKRVSSSSSQSSDIVAGPSKKKSFQVLSESESFCTSMSSDSEVEEICRPKEIRVRRVICSDSDVSSVTDEKASFNKNSTNHPEVRDGGDSSNSEDGERCIICFKSLRPPMARPSNCSHNFHSECLIAWSKTSNTCPFDRVKYTEILVANALGELLDRHSVTTPPPQNHNAEEEEPQLVEGETLCEICLNHDREHEMLLCDRCDAGYHLDCLSPPLDSVPSGTWYCPLCSDFDQGEDYSNDDSPIDEDEMDGLLRDAMNITGGSILTSRRRRNVRSVAQQRRIIRNSISRNTQTSYNRPININQPSTSSHSGTQRQRRRNTTSRRRTTAGRYKVEMVTVEGTTITVKVATNIRRKRKRNNRRQRRRQANGSVGISVRENARNYEDYYPKPLDIYGSRPQLEYFSGFEGGDELDHEENADTAVSSSAGNVLQQRRVNARNINTTSRRKAKVNFCHTPVDLLSTILDQQEKWHNPKSTFHSNSLGEVTVVLHGQVSSTGPMPSKSVPDSTRTNERNNNPNSNTREVARGSSSLSPDFISFPPPPIPVPHPVAPPPLGTVSSPLDVPPLQPPPQPPAKLCVDDDDFDLYADIEPSTSLGIPSTELPLPTPPPPATFSPFQILPRCRLPDSRRGGYGTPSPISTRLAPPPEPPAMLFTLDAGDGSSGDEDERLVIDDDRQCYDPETPTTPPQSPPPAEVRPHTPPLPPGPAPIPVLHPKGVNIAKHRSEKCNDKSSATCTTVNQLDLNEIQLPAAPPDKRSSLQEADDEDDDDLSDSECPNRAFYSQASMDIAKQTNVDSDSDKEEKENNSPNEETIDSNSQNLRKAVNEDLNSSNIEHKKESGKPRLVSYASEDDSLADSCSEVDRKEENEDSEQEGKIDSGCSSKVVDESIKEEVTAISNDVKDDEENDEEEERDNTDSQSESESQGKTDDKNEKDIKNTSSLKTELEKRDSLTESSEDLFEKKTKSDLKKVAKVKVEKCEETVSSENENEDIKTSVEGSKKNLDESDEVEDIAENRDIKENEKSDHECVSDETVNETSKKHLDHFDKLQEEVYSSNALSSHSNNQSTESVSCKDQSHSSDVEDTFENSESNENNEDIPRKRRLSSSPRDDIFINNHAAENKSREDIENARKGERSRKEHDHDDVLELRCEYEDDRDGLVDITDEEISTYERNWEIEDNDNRPDEISDRRTGIEGLDTEAISDCEYTPEEEKERIPQGTKDIESRIEEVTRQENGSKEEGEIVADDTTLLQKPQKEESLVTWKKLSKSTKDRSYREKEESKSRDGKNKKNKKEKTKEKRKELERYDVRKLISEKPKKRRVDEFGRDISSSPSRSRSRGLSIPRDKRRRSPDKRRRSSRSRSPDRGKRRDKSRERLDKVRVRSRSRGRSRSRNRSRERNRSRDRNRSRERGRSSRDREGSVSKKRLRQSSRSSQRRGKKRIKSKERKKRRSPSLSCSTCSCSSCERDRTRQTKKKLTVVVPNNKVTTKKSKKKKKYNDKNAADSSTKRRRLESPVPSKEVFTSGDNILVSVNFKSSKSGEPAAGTGRTKESKKKRNEDDSGKKKRDKSSKENQQPLRTVLSGTSRSQRKINSKNLKPVAIIDLDASPFREQTPSPKEVIVLTDESDSEEKLNQADPCQPSEKTISQTTTGPKTPPEPHIKFNIMSKPQIRSMSNPLVEEEEEEEEEEEDHGGGSERDTEDPLMTDALMMMMTSKGPNTPPEPPVPYDPFEPTKSRSPTPKRDSDSMPMVEREMMILMGGRLSSPEPAAPALKSPKGIGSGIGVVGGLSLGVGNTRLHESPRTPSPLQSPPKQLQDASNEIGLVEKITSNRLSPPPPINEYDSDGGGGGGGGGGDSPYSPGSSEGDDLFEPPMPQITTPTPIAKVKPRPVQQKHPPVKITPSPVKRKQTNNSNKISPLKSKTTFNKNSVQLKLDEDQLKILDDLPNSAVEMQVKDKFLKKLNRQERVVEEVKLVLKPHYAKKHISKEDYKDILRKSVPKICHSRSGEINPIKIQRLIDAYVRKYRHKRKKKTVPPAGASQMLKPKPWGEMDFLEIFNYLRSCATHPQQ
ncbi:uncharacterized protein isoform X4 [Rhodnius prolixus]|uniref:uncharacterized protein isoform X4 n=1 Tax=Rhodnius prolixus TaxID=13249 RepID=UPI003D18EAC9